LLGLSAVGRHASTTIVGGAYEMWLQGEMVTAVIVAFCAVIAPGSYILFMLTVLLALRRPPAPQWIGELLRWSEAMQPWSMAEVMILGMLVALIKIAELATVEPGVGMYAVGGLVVLLPAIMLTFDSREAGKRVEWAGGGLPPRTGGTGRDLCEGPAATVTVLLIAQAGLVSCETCGLLSRSAAAAEPGYCPRCGAELAWRRHHSIQHTWALVIAAAICYVPANVLPVLTTTKLGASEADTIMSGVVFLYISGSWPLALIVLVASVMVPLGKLVALVYLLITVQRGWLVSSRERTRLYRMVEFIGRWSMLDVFVVTFTVALVQLQPLMSVQPAPGVLFFAAVVVLTMIAAESFDPRLIWDSGASKEARHA
jgi:paraquat-inducible protein A